MKFLLELSDVSCQYDDVTVVSGLNLHLRPGIIACLLGPSGCGKTTALRAIAGFEPVKSGIIALRGRTVSTSEMCLPPEQRKLGMVFQDNALFPHLSVSDNVTFGLRRGFGDDRRKRGEEMLELVGLSDTGSRYPHELSGGQQQRVALARALSPKPDLVLLDEPFSSLDVTLRQRLARDVREILKDQGTTALMVTHDQNEAFAVGDQVGVMRAGKLLQWDSPFNLYHEPADPFVADFVGQGRFIQATINTPDTLDTEIGRIVGNRAFIWPKGTPLRVLLRPDDVVPDPDGDLQAVITKKAFHGANTVYTLLVGDKVELLSMFPSHQDHAPGDRVGIRIDAEHLVAFPSATHHE